MRSSLMPMALWTMASTTPRMSSSLKLQVQVELQLPLSRLMKICSMMKILMTWRMNLTN